MKKMIAVLAAAAALTLAAAAPASAGGCRTVRCFNHRIVVLQSEVNQLAGLQSEVNQLTGALNCLQPMAVSRYPGYDYNGYAAATTALDFTESGDAVSTWVMGIPPGTCGAPQTRAAVPSASKSLGTAARDASPFRPFRATPGMTLDQTKTTHGGSR
jgi:hypothetical protein